MQFEPCLAQGRLHAELSLLEYSALLPLSKVYRPGIDCRERVKSLGAVLERLAVGQPKPGLSLLLLLLLLHSDILALQEKGLASREGPTLPSCLR